MFKRLLPVASLLVLLWPTAAFGDTYPRQPGIDAINYVFRLAVSDGTNEIAGETTATVRFVTPGVTQIDLDLAAQAGGKGMKVNAVTGPMGPLRYAHAGERLRITLPAPPSPGQELAITVRYSGVPADGLRLLDNIHGERTMFSESWPNRARQWLPLIDHPYDKATGEFIVTAPAHYQVIANGLLVEEVDLPGAMRRTHWKESVPIASWLFVVGIAHFSAHHYDVVRGVPQEAWVFPQDTDQGYKTFEFTGRRAFEFFSDWIGPYSYEKLAHVEAAGINGGMESATAIMYGEKGVTKGQAPVVHEVAHQWWGNAVTESDWDDVWLSEGFATYFTHLFTEQFGGRDAFVKEMKADIPGILKAQADNPGIPVVHRNLSDMSKVTNRLVYLKGGWTLHMLRGIIGTETFWTGIREYYRRYRDRNASTADLRQVMEQESGQPLSWFFDQWLNRPGIPALSGNWHYDAAAKVVEVELTQTQSEDAYRLPIEIGMTQADGRMRTQSVDLTGRTGRFRLEVTEEPSAVVLDPNTWVLMQAGPFGRRP